MEPLGDTTLHTSLLVLWCWQASYYVKQRS